MKISESFVSALAVYSHRNDRIPYYRIFRRAGYKGHSSRITRILGADQLIEADQKIALKVGKLLNLKEKEVFTK